MLDPAGLGRDVVARLHQFTARLRADIVKWGQVVKAAGVQAD